MIKDSNLRDKLSRQYLDEQKIDTWLDRAFVKVLVKKIQDLDPDIGAVVYPDTKIVVFIWRRIILDKVLLTEYNLNEDIINAHVEQVKRRLRLFKSGFITKTMLTRLQRSSANLNLKSGRQL